MDLRIPSAFSGVAFVLLAACAAHPSAARKAAPPTEIAAASATEPTVVAAEPTVAPAESEKPVVAARPVAPVEVARSEAAPKEEPRAVAVDTAKASTAGDLLEWCPASGAMFRKTLEVRHYLDLANIHKSIDQGVGIDDSLSGQLATWEQLAWTERIDAVADGRVLGLVRRYDDLASGGTADLALPSPTGPRPRTMKQTDTCTSALIGHDVRFTWVPSEQSYGRLWEKLDGPEEFLRDIDFDLDLVSALPGHAVEAEQTWEIPIERVVAFLSPGGNRFFEPRNQDPFARTHRVGAGGEFAALLRAPTGQITATYRGRRTVEGRECGVIALHLEVRSSADRMSAFDSIKPPAEATEPRQLTACTVEVDCKANGEIVWDLEAKRARHYGLEGIETVTMRVSKQAVGADDKASTLHEVTRLEGTFKVDLVNADAPPPPADGTPGEKKN